MKFQSDTDGALSSESLVRLNVLEKFTMLIASARCFGELS